MLDHLCSVQCVRKQNRSSTPALLALLSRALARPQIGRGGQAPPPVPPTYLGGARQYKYPGGDACSGHFQFCRRVIRSNSAPVQLSRPFRHRVKTLLSVCSETRVFRSLYSLEVLGLSMKAVTAMCPTTGATVANGRIRHRRDVENEEIQMYLSKLKDLVPFMPKNRRLTKLEVIQNVIDYICDLQTALEAHPAVNGFDAAAALRTASSPPALGANSAATRQPLGVLATPNTILPPPCEMTGTPAPLVPMPEKLSPSDGRPVSC